MSVSLSTMYYVLFTSTYEGNNAFKVCRFGYIKQDRMIFGLSSVFYDTKISVGIAGRTSHHFEILRRTQVVGATAADQDAAGSQHLECPEIQLFVAAQGGIKVGLALGEGGRVEDNGVIAASGVCIVAQQIKGVGLDPFDLASVK